MARIILTSGLGNQYAGGQTEFEIEAANVRRLVAALPNTSFVVTNHQIASICQPSSQLAKNRDSIQIFVTID